MTTRLPLFPLGVVLFPGALLPLHIFEPRYRRLVTDCLAGGGRFGIICPGEGANEDDLAVGTVGCVAEIERHEPLDDGRSNIVVRGRERFAFTRWVDGGTPYRMGEVAEWEDAGEPAASLAVLNGRVRLLFGRVADAAHVISEAPAGPPPLPDDPARLSFAIAAMMDIGLRDRQALLAERSPLRRLQALEAILAPAAPELEARARVHERAKTNGHGPHHA
ncbi:MAG: LON peptidase substrate-binding domain-containing protein [Gemmatimonadetes bacterium]|nr:LON peptidase substrate-binding domain-containing protein [Gemmatimonadota bacterium]